MENLIRKYQQVGSLNAGFEQGSTNSKEFKQFAKDFKNAFKSELQKIGADIATFNTGHFYLSGFFKKGEKIYYFSWNNGDNQILYRTAKDLKDYTGGCNQYVKISKNTGNQLMLH